ncbi:MAG TPA: type II CAAX endopeptidase family protein, partial [Candidatus Caenarcaniphilales bacterium]
TRNALIGETPFKDALSRYQETRQSAQSSLKRLTQAASVPPIKPNSQVDPELGSSPLRRSPKQQLRQLTDQLDLNLGILWVQSGQPDKALQAWKNLLTQPPGEMHAKPMVETAQVLMGLWSNPPRLLPNAEQQLMSHLNGWFQYRALTQLYQLQQRGDALATLQAAEQQQAQNAFIRLSTISGLSVAGNLVGLGLVITWVVQQIVRQKQAPSPLSHAEVEAAWPVPWNGEVIWQVLVLWFVAFFGVSLVVVPLAVQLLGLNPASFTARTQTFLALFTYLGLVIAGLSVLYLCLQPFLPLPRHWFHVSRQGNWIGWGLGGYLAALPLVTGVSLINQRLLQNQGGGNPLLEIILQSRDTLTISVLFLMVAVFAPFFEETLFRGFLLPSLTRYLPVWGAILTSGFLFAVAHLNLSDILPLTILGVILGFVYLRSRNLLASMLLHSIWNTGSFLGLLILSGASG